MKKSLTILTGSFALLSLLAVTIYSMKPQQAQAPRQHPILNMVANKVIQKYQTSTCEQLWVKKAKRLRQALKNKKSSNFLKAIRRCAPSSSTRWQLPSPTKCLSAG